MTVLNIANAGTNGTNGVANIASLSTITGVTYTAAHVYCNTAISWTDFTTGAGTFFIQQTGNRFDQWVAAVPGRKLLLSPGMIPSSAYSVQTIASLGALSGTGTGTCTASAIDPSWPVTGNFNLEVRATQFAATMEIITVNIASGVTLNVVTRGVGGSTATAWTGNPSVSIDWRVQGATGTFNTFWQQWGIRLVAAGLGNSIIRLAHECNATYEPHYIGYFASQRTNWVTYFQNIVTTLKAISGQQFTFEFNVSPNGQALAQSNYYPGNTFVDYIGIDQYDETTTAYHGTTGQQWNTILNGQGVVGLASVLAFAVTNNKPMAFSEWALAPTISNGFGDDPTFIINMATLFGSSTPPNWAGGTVPPVAYQSLYNPIAVSGSTVTSPYGQPIESSPNSLTAYIAQFTGAGATNIAPVFTAFSCPGGTVGTAYTYTVTASGTPAPTFSIGSGALPTGLSLNSITGVISGTPTIAGTSTFTITASNSAGNVTTPSLQIVISPSVISGSIPVFSADSPPTAAVGTLYSYLFVASGTPPPTFLVSSGILPSGITLDSTGILSGVPSATGIFTFTVSAVNAVGQATTSPLTLTIGPAGSSTAGTSPMPLLVVFNPQVTDAPTFSSASPPSAQVNNPYNYLFVADQFPTFAVVSGSVPPGLSLDSTGVLSGTPTTAGTFSFTVSASNSIGTVDTSSISIIVSPAVVPVPVNTVLPSLSFSTLLVGSVISATTGNWTNTPTSYLYQWNSNGTNISGATAFTYTLTSAEQNTSITCSVTAVNDGGSGVQATSPPIAVPPPLTAPVFTASTPSSSAQAGTAYIYTFQATGFPTPTWTVASGSLPAGIALSGSTISGIPTTAGTSTFTIEASNSQGNVTTGSLSIVVAAQPVPTIVTVPVITGTAAVGHALALVDNGVWNNNPNSYSYQWHNSVSGNITGATSSSYTVQTSDQGDNLTCIITATNFGGNSSPATTSPVAIPSATPVAPAFVTSTPPNTATVGLTYSYTFVAGGTPAPTFSVTSGALPAYMTLASNGVLSGVPGTVGTSTFVVTASNTQGTAATGSLSIVVSALPASNGVPIYGGNNAISGTPTVGNIMSMFSGAWTNSPSTFNYQWNRNGTPISGAISNNYTTVTADGETNLSCTITATNTTGTSAPVTSSSVFIASAGGGASGAPLLPDMTVSSVAIPTGLVVGDSAQFVATVQNQGLGATPSGNFFTGVQFYVDNNYASESTSYGQTIGPGQSVQIPADADWIATVGNHQLSAVVNNPPEYEETDVTNNETTVSFSVAALPLAWQIIEPPEGAIKTTYSHKFICTNADTISYSSGTIPPGLTLNDSGLLSGVPTTAGTYNFTLLATNFSYSAAVVFTLTVKASSVTITWTIKNPDPGVKGVHYSYQFVASGATSIVVRVGSSLPPGLTLSASGLLSGTPTTAGTYTFLLDAVNASEAIPAGPFTLVIAVGAIVWQTLPHTLANAALGQAYSPRQFVATNATLYQLAPSITPLLPPGISLSSSGAISGTPTKSAQYQFSIIASNSSGSSVTQGPFILNVTTPYTYNPTYLTAYWYYPNTAGYTSIEWLFKPIQAPPSSMNTTPVGSPAGLTPTHYYAMTWYFQNANTAKGTGYAGLQSNGIFNGNEQGRVINFSIWGSTNGRSSNSSTMINAQNVESGGYQLMLRYNWVVGHQYKFVLTHGPGGVTSTGAWWGLTVIDDNTAVSTFVGEIFLTNIIGGNPSNSIQGRMTMFGEDTHWWKTSTGETKIVTPTSTNLPPSALACIGLSANNGAVSPNKLIAQSNAGVTNTGTNGYKTTNVKYTMYVNPNTLLVQCNLGIWDTAPPNTIPGGQIVF